MSIKKHKLDRKKLKPIIGHFFNYNSVPYQITQLIDFHEVIGVNVETNEAKKLLISGLQPLKDNDVVDNGYIHKDIDDFSTDDWKKIEKRFNAISPLLKGASRKDIEKHSIEIGIHYTTLYRWKKGYDSVGNVMGLLPSKRGRKKGAIFIEEDIEKIISDVIENHYLTVHKPSIKSVINKVKIQCLERNLAFPSDGTIRNRISQLSQYKVLKQRTNKSLANDYYRPTPNKYTAEYPLQIVQIDHTKVDLQILDDIHRLPIGRPWLTLAIDIYSRMIVGYYLSLDDPSGISVGMCLVNSILNKDKLLNEFDINSEWNVWGKMDNLACDNGADFQSYSVQESCFANAINIEFRPIGKKEYGGHIERLIGTTMTEVHDIPGTTFSSIKDRLTYDSEGNACMTFSDFEKWVLIYITKIYQHNKHTEINTTPLEQWKKGIFGTSETVGIGYPQLPTDPLSMTIDFLPTIKRTIQKNGVTIDGLTYYEPILNLHIKNLTRRQQGSKDKKYIFKRDPRDISNIWFYDEMQQEYYLIPLANAEIPIMSLFELKKIKTNIESNKNQLLNEHNIIRGYKELYEHVENAQNQTKKHRKHMQKIKNNNKQSKITTNIKENEHLKKEEDKFNSDIWNQDIPDFG